MSAALFVWIQTVQRLEHVCSGNVNVGYKVTLLISDHESTDDGKWYEEWVNTAWVEQLVKQLSFIKLEVRNIFTGVVDSQVQINWDSKSCSAGDILSDNFVSASESWDKTLARWWFCGKKLLLFSVEDAWCLLILQ